MTKVHILTKHGLSQNLIKLALGDLAFELVFHFEENLSTDFVHKQDLVVVDDAAFTTSTDLALVLNNLAVVKKGVLLQSQAKEISLPDGFSKLVKPFNPADLRKLLS